MIEFLYGVGASAALVFVSFLVWDTIVTRIKKELFVSEGEFDRRISSLSDELYDAINSECGSLSQDVRDVHSRIDENCTKK